jgi:hypothetical protein
VDRQAGYWSLKALLYYFTDVVEIYALEYDSKCLGDHFVKKSLQKHCETVISRFLATTRRNFSRFFYGGQSTHCALYLEWMSENSHNLFSKTWKQT